jgi:ribonucleotide monophosphatase NagD (HAD superfamily)
MCFVTYFTGLKVGSLRTCGFEIDVNIYLSPFQDLTQKPNFGIIFDIDGVLLRGKTPIPSAKAAITTLMDETNEQFIVPTVFCTNGFGLPEVKAATLTEKLGVPVSPDQIVMSQTPLQMFHDLHDKWCLISGPEHEGGAVAVAKR